MSRSLRRGTLAASAIAFSIASLAACGAGNNAQTLGVRPDNASTSIGGISIQNATVVTRPEAADKGTAAVTAKLFNNGRTAQTLDAITLPDTGATVTITPAKGAGPLKVPAGGSILIGGDGNASAVIQGGDEPARNGDAQRVVFQFSDTGDIALDAFVVPATGPYESFGPSAAPSPSASAGASEEPGGTPSEGASGAPEGEESPAGEPTDGESEAPAGEEGTVEGADQGTDQGEQSTPTDAASASTDPEH
ncbi:DUF461 domain-containing protein [Streptomyces sp. NBC_01498]|uniref:DUF461 domain-containing protein n=1 Tax=Streptomyces sp. NBC_01498 TaxID=2975870 RepID=UPI002E7C2479|nr:DUF461 domain-containing protein [Streptomyces sp. NBC_01498]WTL26154.1 DUF461 domain-containing protein [Streptomyces sp. NBC_01498]